MYGVDLDYDTVVWAYGHPLRWAIWRHFIDAGVVASAQDVANDIGAPVENVAYHVRRLHERGLLRHVRTDQRRGRRARMYTPVPSWISDDVWERLPVRLKRSITLRALASIAREIRTEAERGGFDRKDSVSSYHRLSVSEEEWLGLRQAIGELVERARMLQPRDIAGDGVEVEGTAVSANVVLMLFEEPPRE